LVAIGLLSFLFYLDRYPAPYFDDGVLNQPAARVLDGLSFASPQAAAAPHGYTVWAYHAPFFPHMQVVTFRVLGVSTFASRIPQWLAASLAIFLLAGTLIRAGRPWSAVLLAGFWLGDRSLVESLYGRMDAIALLFLAGAFASFTQWLSTGSGRAAFLAGLLSGTAVGFHPVTMAFVAGIGVTGALFVPAGKRRSLFHYAIGFLLPMAAILAFVAPHFGEALEQFRWSARLAQHAGPLRMARNLISVLRWSRYWPMALVAVTVLLLLPVTISMMLRVRSKSNRPDPLILSSGVFAICGCAALFGVAVLPYYLIYFTVWPVMAVLVLIESRVFSGVLRRLCLAALALLVAAWLPSAAWNVMRCREARIFYPKFDPSVFVARVRAVVPPGAPLMVSPDYGLLSHLLGRDLSRPALAKAVELPPLDWLVLSSTDVRRLGGPQALSGRKVAFSGTVYPETDAGGLMTIFTPAETSKP
jgi:hypothetical protein